MEELLDCIGKHPIAFMAITIAIRAVTDLIYWGLNR